MLSQLMVYSRLNGSDTDMLTMSSGSSGSSVALPEPSFFSMLCLTRRMMSLSEIERDWM